MYIEEEAKRKLEDKIESEADYSTQTDRFEAIIKQKLTKI